MVGTLTNKDTYVPSVQELQEQFNAPSYRKEETESTERNELTTEQINEVKSLLKEANEKNPGVVCPRDEVKYLTFLERDCNPEQRLEAIQELPDHLEKKAVYLEEYEADVNEHFSFDEKLTPKGEKLLQDYKNMTGVERKDAAKKLKALIKERVQEKKSYEELLFESPHFSENGELTPKAQEMFEQFQMAQGGVRRALKRKLLEQLRQHERAEKQCEQFYKAANTLYEKGQFFTGELLIEFVIKLCDKYEDSPRMQVIREWNQRDLENLKDHTAQQREINKLLLLRDAFMGSEDIDSAFEVSKELRELSEHFLNFTSDRNGEMVARKEKYKTSYLKNLHQEIVIEHRVLSEVKREKDKLEEEQDAEVITEKMQEFMTTNEGKAYAVEMGALEEELGKTDEQERTDERAVLDVEPDANEDIANLTDQELDGNQEDENEVVMDFTQSSTATNQHRAERLSQLKNVNTGVSKDGRLITNMGELQKMTDKRTDQFVDHFVDQQKKEGGVSRKTIENFHDAMHQLTGRGEISQNFTVDSRGSGREVVEFGARFQQTAKELGEKIAGQGTVEVERSGSVINLAEALRRKRQQIRQAA